MDRGDAENYSGGTTGDSGFSEVKDFLRVDLADKAVSNYYKTVHKKDVDAPSYYKGSRGSAQKYHGQCALFNEVPSPSDCQLRNGGGPSPSHTTL